MKLVNKVATISLLAVSVTGTSYAVIDEDFDFQKINERIQATLRNIVSTSSSAESLTVTIRDDETDVAKDRYAAEMAAVLKNAAWTTNSVDLSATVRLESTLIENRPLTRVAISARMKTDVLAFFKFAASKHRCPLPAFVTGAERIFMNEHCELASDIRNATSMAGVKGMIEESMRETQSGFESYLSDIALQLKNNAREGSEVTYLLRQEQERTERYLAALRSSTLVAVGEGYRLTVPGYAVNEMLSVGTMEIVLNADQLDVRLSASTPLGRLNYEAVKPEIVRMLRGLETGESFASDLVQMRARVGLRLWELLNTTAQQ